MTNPLIERLEELRSKAATMRQYGPEDERRRAWSQYHHALQAEYERGGLVPKPTIEAATDYPPLTVNYTNWRGVRAVRRIIPVGVWFGSSRWHPEDQFFMSAWDVDKGEMRDFAIRDMSPV